MHQRERDNHAYGRWAALTVAAYLLAAMAGAGGAMAQTAHPHPAIRITYLANEGVMLQGAGGRVLIDALFGEGLPEYAVVPRGLRDSLERALEGFGGPAVVLTTHPHRDHHDAAALARYLGNNLEAIAVGPPETAAQGPASPVDRGWVKVQPLAIPHGPTSRPVGHSAYLVTINGTTALHVGDTQSDPTTWRALGVPAGGVDLAFIPFWYALDEERFKAVLEVTAARRVVLLHTPLDRAEAPDRGLRQRYQQVWIPERPGEVMGR